MISILIGKRVSQLRHRLGLSQIVFAEQIGMARTYFAEVETGRRNISVRNLEKITSGLGVTLAEFFESDIFEQLYQPSHCATKRPVKTKNSAIHYPLD